MSYYSELQKYQTMHFTEFFDSVEAPRINKIIKKTGVHFQDFLALLAPNAGGLLEEMAQKANQITIQQFGRTILLYTPLYLANYCINHCLYCGFNVSNNIERHKLTLAEVELEAREIAKTGLKHLLILTGESRQHSPVAYLKECVSVLKKYFDSVSIEIYPLTIAEYAELIKVGIDGVTIYQEVYDEQVYARLHPQGPKRDYRFRLEAPERAGKAGIRTINIGALMGLADWRSEVFLTGVHAYYLQKWFPAIEIGVSFPRMRPHHGSFLPPFPVSDGDLVQAILALRLFLPRVGITISTRENSRLRDNLIKLGVTKMSAGSSTVVGGHSVRKDGAGQFEIFDHRSVTEIQQAIASQGYKPIFKDWHLLEVNCP